MLKNIDPLISAELLYLIAEMGHGDELVLVDRNFPARSVANETSSGKLIRTEGCNVTQIARALFSLFPLDSFVDEPIIGMQTVGSPGDIPEVQQEVLKIAIEAEGKTIRMGSFERMQFYQQAKQSYAVVSTGENRPYGCFILKKGVIFPDTKT